MRIFKHLTFTDRLRIERMLKEEKSKQEIADVLRVHISTIYREIERGQYTHLNSDLKTETRYSPDIAHKKYRENLAAKGTDLKIGNDHELADFLESIIVEQKYSPDAALGEIKRQGLKFKTTICRVTLYSYISKGVFLRLTNKDLPRRGIKKRAYRRVRTCKAPRGESIERRPDEINKRIAFGHWEMDTIVGRKNSKKALLVLTERLTRKEIAIRISDKTTASVVKALDRLERKFGNNFSKIFKSITVDNGSEFADCENMERSIYSDERRTKMYYCHPYSAYERGSNENQNSIIRRWFPKGTSFDRVTVKMVQWVEDWINNYPRAIFGYASSNDLFNKYMEKVCT